MKYIFVILLLMISNGCATTPKPVSFDADWEFKGEGNDRKACLSLEDVKRLREILVTKCK